MLSKGIQLLAFLLCLTFSVEAQKRTLDITYCYQKADDLSPLKKQELLNQGISELNVKNHSGNYLPSLSMTGKATYQSEVIRIPGTAAFPDYPMIPKEQFQVTLNIQQYIYDGGVTKHSKLLEDARLHQSASDLSTELYRTRETINTLYFSSLQLQSALEIINASLKTLLSQRKTIESGVRNGILLESNLYAIDKQILSLEQEIISIESDRRAFLAMLSDWIGEPLNDDTELRIPDVYGTYQDNKIEINRPENDLFKSQRDLLEAQYGFSNVSRTPRIWAFAQAGIGQPNPMNFFEVDPSGFYIVGLQFNWNIYDWGNTVRDKQVYRMQQEIVQAREEDFNRNLQIALNKNYSDLDKYRSILAKDHDIISLQDKIVKSAFSELTNGVINSTEYLIEENALTKAKILKSQHEIDMSKTYINLLTTSGHEYQE